MRAKGQRYWRGFSALGVCVAGACLVGVSLLSGALLGAGDPAVGPVTPGVTDTEIVIGSCSALEGPS